MDPRQVSQVYHNYLAHLALVYNENVGSVCTRVLPILQSYGVIEQTDYDYINKATDTMDKANRLFKEIMPTKREGLHRLLILALRLNTSDTFVEFLETEINKLEQGNQGSASANTRSFEVILQKGNINLAAAFSGQREHNLPPTPAACASYIQPSVQAVNTVFGSYQKEMKELETPCHGYLFLPVQKISFQPASNFYKNCSKPKGLALLINNQKYSSYQERIGSQVDFANMHMLLNKLGYHVHCKTDREGDEMLADAKYFKDCFSLRQYDSCIVVLMCYSKNGDFLGVDEKPVAPKVFFNGIINCEALMGKPKLFFIQACRQAMVYNGVEDLTSVKKMEEEAIEALRNQLPGRQDGKDFFIFYSTTPGYYNWKNEERGSWFFETICEEFASHSHEKIYRIVELCSKVRESIGKKLTHLNLLDHIELPDMEWTQMSKHFHFFPGCDGR